MQRVHPAVRRIDEGRKLPLLVSTLLLCTVAFVVACGFMKGAYEGLREEYISRLERERTALAENDRLKTEIYALTRTRLAEYQAREKLGLKKANEPEVLVVR
jgi:hypothetical protein